MHVLEAGHESDPCLLLLHGFPELAYSWRKVMVPLAAAGFHVVAPDQRGYGRTTGWDPDYDGDLGSFRMTNLAMDALELVFSLGHRTVRAVVGHDFGAPVAAYCALIRPDVFRSLALMSHTFADLRPCRLGSTLLQIRATPSTMTWRLCHVPASTIAGTTPRGRRTTTSSIALRVCTHSYAPIITTRARTGPETGLIP
jgi:pimeloyl-ACP methyl ester carboxylesterase